MKSISHMLIRRYEGIKHRNAHRDICWYTLRARNVISFLIRVITVFVYSFCRFTAHALKRIARMHSRLDARVCHYTHSSVWIMRDGRLIIILIVTYNIRCIGAISFTCVHGTYIRRYIFLDQLFSRATMRDHSERGSASRLFIYFYFPLGKIEYIIHVSRNIGAMVIHNEEFCLVVSMLKFFRIEHRSVSLRVNKDDPSFSNGPCLGQIVTDPSWLRLFPCLYNSPSFCVSFSFSHPLQNVYMFFRWTYFPCNRSMMHFHMFQNLFKKTFEYNNEK